MLGERIVETDLYLYDYVRDVTAVEVKLFSGEQNYLAVLADLRATSGHTILLIYSPDGKVVYHEMLDRRQRPVKMGVYQFPDLDVEGLLVENESDFLYSSRLGIPK